MVEEQQNILDSLTTSTKCLHIDELKKGLQFEHWIVAVKKTPEKTKEPQMFKGC